MGRREGGAARGTRGRARRAAAGALAGAVALLASGLLPAAGQGRAGEPEAGAFDYYVLALSWNAAWCEAEGDARRAPQCDPAEDIGFTLHGLWPQREADWPEFCRAPRRDDPSRRESARMADLYGSSGLAWYQWRKHGRCSGLSGAEYFALARRAWGLVRRPALLRDLREPVEVRAEVVEAAFLEANPGLTPEAVEVTCRDGLIREVRICLDRELAPRACSASAARACRRGTLLPMR